MSEWVRMVGGGITGGTILTSEGNSVVAEDGSFMVPRADVEAMLARGAKFLINSTFSCVRTN